MGRRSVKATKSGKFMNPTDQARKEARKKELKKNKKQRLLVRTAVLKNKDPGLIIKELDKLDEVEYNPTEQPALAEKVLKDKRKKLRETLERVMKLYQKENPTYWNDLKRVEADYERRRFHRIQHYEAVKQAENVGNVEDIPLPDIPAPAEGEVGDIPLPEGGPPPMLMPTVGHPSVVHANAELQGILKKSPMLTVAPGTPTYQGRDPPGVPCGPPPDLSDLDEDSEEEMEVEPEQPKLVDNKTKGVRFSDADAAGKDKEEKTLLEIDRFMKEVEEDLKSMNEEELQPPGTAKGAEEGDEDDEDEDDSQSPDPEEAELEPTDVEGSEIVDDDADSSTATPESIEVIPIPTSSSAIPIHPTMRPPTHQPPPHFFPPPPHGMAPPHRMSYPPPMPPMMRHNYNQPPPRHMGSFMPPGGPGARYRPPPRNNIFSGTPQLVKSDNKIVSDSMIQAKPQIRSLSADVTRFVPTIVKTKKEEPDRPRRPEYQIGQSHLHFKPPQTQKPPQQKSKDDAYAEFMKEMQGLM